MKYYLIAGEASGDLHGSNLMAALKKTDPQAEFRFWGGDRMATEAGHAPVKHISELAFMGFVEVLMNLPTILNNMSLCKKDISNFQPQVLVLIDYPGFNLRIAEWAKKKAYKVAY
ncbi:lipid-A-disaccharide synthase, partial [bacterium]|nr:lipid-A-disaccharide synthase [bacterium]